MVNENISSNKEEGFSSENNNPISHEKSGSKKRGFWALGFICYNKSFIPDIKKKSGEMNIDPEQLSSHIDGIWKNKNNGILCYDSEFKETKTDSNNISYFLIDTGFKNKDSKESIYGAFWRKNPGQLDDQNAWCGVFTDSQDECLKNLPNIDNLMVGTKGFRVIGFVPNLTESLRDLQFLCGRSIDSQELNTHIENVWKKLDSNYIHCYDADYQEVEQNNQQIAYLLIDTKYKDKNNGSIYGGFWRTSPGILLDDKNIWQGVTIGSSTECFKKMPVISLQNWAYIPSDKYYEDLKHMALPEPWNFAGEEGFDILINYLSYTFTKLKHDNKIVFSKDGRYAAFNTGLVKLVNTDYMPIVACFERNFNPVNLKNLMWTLNEFVVWGLTDSKKYNLGFPERAEYFDKSKRTEEMLFNNDREIVGLTSDHIIIDNINRLPLEFLEKQLKIIEPIELQNFNIIELLSKETRASIKKLKMDINNFCKNLGIEQSVLSELINKKLKNIKYFRNVKDAVSSNVIITENDVNPLQNNKYISQEIKGKIIKLLNEAIGYEILREKIDKNTDLKNSFSNRITSATHLAVSKTKWNYRTAIPMYYPKLRQMSLLLPLCLTNDQKVDAALVVSPQGESWYQAQTILNLRQAYLNSRLVTRPESDWLNKETLSQLQSDGINDELDSDND